MQQTRSFSLRGRIIPAFALSLVVALLALLTWAIVSPKSGNVAQNGRINAVGSYIPFEDRTAANFEFQDLLTGETVALADLRGKPVIVNFWASWCPPCKEEAPIFAELHNTLGSEVAVVGVAVWDKESDSKDFLEQYGLTYPNGSDADGSIAIDYGVAGVPETYFVDAEGQLAGKYPGPIESVEQVQGILQEINGG